MKPELRPLDRAFADFIMRESGCDSPELRLAASLVSCAVGQGDICLDLGEYAGQTMPVGGQLVALPGLDSLIAVLRRFGTVGAPGQLRPLILDDAGRLYLHRYWQYEQELARFVLERAGGAAALDEATLRAGLDRLFPRNNGEDIDWQAVAAVAAIRKRFCIISGGPGTGKTSTVVKILALMLEQQPDCRLRIALAAPTGKAAARLKDAITAMKGRLPCADEIREQIPAEVFTLHRLLGTMGGSLQFRHTADNPLPHDVVVIDEASMVALPLMARLVTALKPEARLIFLGDRDQLASVEAGAVLGDLCGAGAAESFSKDFCGLVRRLTCASVAEHASPNGESPALTDALVILKKNYRFPEQSGIGRLATALNGGQGTMALDLLCRDMADARWQDLPPLSALKNVLTEAVVEGYRHYLAAAAPQEALARFDGFRVLCALRDGPCGVAGITRMVEEILAEHRLIDLRSRWYQGRPVMITVNDYALKLFNGDVGIVFPDPAASGTLRVFFPAEGGGVRTISPLRLPAHETVYAMTVHKSQGSEFGRVLMVLPDHDTAALSRELLYTGVTRAISQVVVWGVKETFVAAVARRIRRNSGLSQALGMR